MWDSRSVECWEKMVGFLKVKAFIHCYKVVYDCAERGVKLITDLKDV
jgi:hypothetical protein